MIINTKQEFERQGSLLFNEIELPLTDAEWQRIETLLDEVEYEHIVGGDAGEGHSVRVCRFYNDVDKPVALHAHSKEISRIVMSAKMIAFYKKILGSEELCLRRCQANRLQQGDYIGMHVDQDSNPDYFATVVFHFDATYKGGDFITRDQQRGDHSYSPQRRAVLINDCSIPHEVSTVESGQRKTLACFLSKNFSDSNHHRKEFKVVK
ncbi:MAG: 2OG-Fe(II) oxygenase [Gammaproteobacteria bacterium]|nr:2OG-Fe(II) oxygenase [Gammaproteobacteria bacterium]